MSNIATQIEPAATQALFLVKTAREALLQAEDLLASADRCLGSLGSAHEILDQVIEELPKL
jgi:hypothetical protein